jgi:hypothetical protein
MSALATSPAMSATDCSPSVSLRSDQAFWRNQNSLVASMASKSFLK